MRCLSPQGGALSADGRRLSVRLSDSKSKMEGRRKLKIDRKEADKHRPNLEVERPKVKVTKPISVETDNATNFELGAGMETGVRVR